MVRRIVLIPISILLLGILLVLDLTNQGLVWNFFWSQTGEEAPFSQLQGMVELGANFLRPPLQTASQSPINHAHEIPYGINVFLHEEVEEPKIHEQLRMIQAAGFKWLRQEFPWEDIEVDGRGQFTDSRNDYNDDGILDTISAWDKYDRLVDLVEEYGFQMMVRLSNPPNWSRANPDAGEFAPPDDFQDFANYAQAVATRYQGRIHYYQIWNEPNIFPEWGNNFVDPAGYTELLCQTYAAIKSIDPEIVVISGALAPTISLDGYSGYSDVVFLQNMYDNGAGDCFDVLSVQGYGLYSGPTDHRVGLTTVNYTRHLLIRDVMVANGDAEKAIWLSEAAWNAVPSEDQRPDVADRYRYGQVTEEQAARYMPIAYERAQQDWNWIGNIFYWFFTRRTIEESNQSFYYFRMAEADYSPEKPTFSPLPVYTAMQEHILNADPVLYPGTHQAEDWAITYTEGNEHIRDENAAFGNAVTVNRSMSFKIYGTEVWVRWRPEAEISGLAVSVNGEKQLNTPHTREETWVSSQAVDLFVAAEYEIVIDGFGSFAIDSIVVLDHTFKNVFPWAVIGISILLPLLVVIGLAIRKRLQR